MGFNIAHVLPLFIATAQSLGGLLPIFAPVRAVSEFGLPERFVLSPLVHTCFVVQGARISILGTLMWLFYLQGNLAAVDTIMALTLWIGVVDGWMCWREGVPRKAVMRAGAAGVVGVWGLLGLTERWA